MCLHLVIHIYYGARSWCMRFFKNHDFFAYQFGGERPDSARPNSGKNSIARKAWIDGSRRTVNDFGGKPPDSAEQYSKGERGRVWEGIWNDGRVISLRSGVKEFATEM